MEKFQKTPLELSLHEIVLSSVFVCIYAVKRGGIFFFKSFYLWLTYIITPPFQDFFSGQVFLFLWFALLLMFYDYDCLNFIAFILASFKL